MSDPLSCWKCGAVLELLLPLSRREECPACGADLHCCRFCRHFDPRVAGQCREERAEEVTDKARANFCDYIEPNPHAYDGAKSSDAAARAQLAELFGEAPVADVQDAKDAGETPVSEADRAMEELKRLFGEGPDKT